MALFLAATILWALIWLLYRAYQVCQTPNEILVDKLGLDIPPSPEVTLEEIGAREIRLAWKQPDFQNSIHKHIIHVDGVKAGESKRTETAVVISNLNPGNIYHICVFAVSAANFHTSSAVLHVRTKRVSQSPTLHSAGNVPTIRAYVPKPTPALMAPSAPVMSREHSGGQVQGKRMSGGRKLSPAALQDQTMQIPMEEFQKSTVSESMDKTLEQLAARLKNLQQENEALEKQIFQEEKEHEALLKELEENRDEMKQRVKEKDEASGDLRKHVNKLESVNRTAQSDRSKREKLLQQKESERKRRKDDILRWGEQCPQMVDEASQAREEKIQVEEEAANQVSEYRAKIADEQTEMKAIDEDIKVNGSRIKQLEEERKMLEGDDNEDGKELDRIEKERDRYWDARLANLRAQYASLMGLHSQAQLQHQEALERLRWITSQRTNAAGPFVPLPSFELEFPQKPIQRRSHHRNSLASNVSSPISFPLMDTNYSNPPNYTATSSGSPTFPSSSAFFNINNGMTISAPSDELTRVRTETETVTGNPPMSPRADSLLPSDLLGDEDPLDLAGRPTKFPEVAPQFDNRLQGSPSTVSSPNESRPASALASPHESLNDLQDVGRSAGRLGNGAPDRDEASDGVQSASKRLSGFLGFHRQRGKTLADGPPLLGTLKPGQSQSFPRNLDQGLDPIGTRRRRLSYTGNWANPMTNLLSRNTTANITTDSSSDHTSSRKAAFPNFFSTGRLGSGSSSNINKSSLDTPGLENGYNQFSPRHDPIDPSILGTVRRGSLSPRPSSTYSFENYLPRPSTEAQPFGWPAPDKAGHRGNPIGFDWPSPNSWSRNQSRRPSVQVGSSSHLPIGMPSADSDFFQTSYDVQRPMQAPIGTRPPSSHRPVTPKLNPAAPSFKTIFSKRSDKGKDKAKNEDDEHLHFRDHDLSATESSPPASRHSKDSRSIPTSAAESYESLERMPSGTPSESAHPKETFIQKITRKSSSSKFNLSWKERAGLFSKKGDTSSQGDIDEVFGNESQLGKSFESVVSSNTSTGDKSTKSSLGFGFMRKSKKADKTASESSERASETGDEETGDEF
ncbi:hypothetical protein FQN54_000179 [Arachnomyces sp. PD_36]|nr:hypothetical protein FQN54_000179 [Arachnomyces sp. PD_36]